MNKKLMKKIDDFMKDKRKSNGGYAEVRDKDIIKLSEIIREICEAKYEKDPDGDIPINWDILDRTKYEPLDLLQVPYSHKDKDGHFKAVVSNLTYFSERLYRLCRHGNIKIKGNEDEN